MTAHAASRTNLVGLLLSVGCVLHCMLMPLCIASLPAWGLSWLISPRFHQSLAVAGVALGMITLIPGWRVHRRSKVLILALGGLSIMNYAAFAGDEEESCCSQKACCSATETASDSELETAASPVDSLKVPFEWLWNHPTVFGAALLGWAHCLNGHCSRRCCQPQNVEPMPLSV